MDKIQPTSRKLYVTPKLIVYGQFRDITSTVGMGTMGDGGPGMSGVNKTA